MKPAPFSGGAQAAQATRPAVVWAPMTLADLDAVLAIEQTAYGHPWTRGNFQDSLNPLFEAQCLWQQGQLLGYFLAMRGVEEMHLLNITVAPDRQGQGWGRRMLDALSNVSQREGAQWLWLEVRSGNTRAQAVYRARGFEPVGRRTGYYAAGRCQREDAVVMRLAL